ncbi:LADA_0E06502g1_1 [Lachancea dasiensis]|uniref:LADA_0E06502g1_1 n=1 Tax=Lachancea dasiensis TaxID=1072105 RepID=A0A1G4JD55_9SACH|nr:LADA_0E06502g1_1 [Lachancea dasiensis]
MNLAHGGEEDPSHHTGGGGVRNGNTGDTSGPNLQSNNPFKPEAEERDLKAFTVSDATTGDKGHESAPKEDLENVMFLGKGSGPHEEELHRTNEPADTDATGFTEPHPTRELDEKNISDVQKPHNNVKSGTFATTLPIDSAVLAKTSSTPGTTAEQHKRGLFGLKGSKNVPEPVEKDSPEQKSNIVRDAFGKMHLGRRSSGNSHTQSAVAPSTESGADNQNSAGREAITERNGEYDSEAHHLSPSEGSQASTNNGAASKVKERDFVLGRNDRFADKQPDKKLNQSVPGVVQTGGQKHPAEEPDTLTESAPVTSEVATSGVAEDGRLAEKIDPTLERREIQTSGGMLGGNYDVTDAFNSRSREGDTLDPKPREVDPHHVEASSQAKDVNTGGGTSNFHKAEGAPAILPGSKNLATEIPTHQKAELSRDEAAGYEEYRPSGTEQDQDQVKELESERRRSSIAESTESTGERAKPKSRSMSLGQAPFATLGRTLSGKSHSRNEDSESPKEPKEPSKISTTFKDAWGAMTGRRRSSHAEPKSEEFQDTVFNKKLEQEHGKVPGAEADKGAFSSESPETKAKRNIAITNTEEYRMKHSREMPKPLIESDWGENEDAYAREVGNRPSLVDPHELTYGAVGRRKSSASEGQPAYVALGSHGKRNVSIGSDAEVGQMMDPAQVPITEEPLEYDRTPRSAKFSELKEKHIDQRIRTEAHDRPSNAAATYARGT